MQNLLQIFEEDENEQSGLSKAAGGVGVWLLHLCKLTFLVYSATHTVNASLSYAGSTVPAKTAQVVGIIVTEMVLLGIYLAYVNRKLSGSGQLIAAGLTYLLGFMLACLGIVADSQLNGGQPLTPFLVQYLKVGLPISPAVMSLGAIIVHVLSPQQLRATEFVRQSAELDKERFKAELAQERLTMQEDNARKALQVLSKQALLRELANVFESPEFADAVKRTAIDKAPSLFAEAGITINRPISLPAPKHEPSSDTAESDPQKLITDLVKENPALLDVLGDLLKERDFLHQNGSA